MTCYYEGNSYPEGAYICDGPDRKVCFEGRFRLALANAPECTGTVGGWKVLKTIDVTLLPSEETVGGWRVLKTFDVTLIPSEEISGGWKVLRSIDVTIIPEGYVPPPPECKTDADCPEGKKCVDGKCVDEKGLPWEWMLAGGLGVGAAILLAPKKKT